MLWDEYINTCKMRISTFLRITLEMNWGLECNYSITSSQTTVQLETVRKDCQFALCAWRQISLGDSKSLYCPSCLKVTLLTRAIFQSQFVNVRDNELLPWISMMWGFWCFGSMLLWISWRHRGDETYNIVILCVCVFCNT